MMFWPRTMSATPPAIEILTPREIIVNILLQSPPPPWPRPRGGPPPLVSFFPSDVLALSKRVTRGRLGAFALFHEPFPRCRFASLSLSTRSATLLSTFTVGVMVSGPPYEVLLRSESLYPAGESFG